MTFAPLAREALVAYFDALAARDAEAADDLEHRLQHALEAADAGASPELPVVLPGGRTILRVFVSPLRFFCERRGAALHVLRVDTA